MGVSVVGRTRVDVLTVHIYTYILLYTYTGHGGSHTSHDSPQTAEARAQTGLRVPKGAA